MDSDESLYLKVKSGNLTAYDALYARHKHGLYRFLITYLKNAEETEEVFHETFLKVFQNPDVDFQNGSFKGWLYLIARNGALNLLRSRKRADKASIEIVAQPPPASTDSHSEKDLLQQIQNHLKSLPAHLQDVLHLRLSGWANPEIAMKLNIPVGTVKSRYHTVL